MKKSFIAISIAALILSACSGNSTHQHEDGSVHQDHDTTKAKQEEFSVPADSLSQKSQPEKEHTHDGHEHPHKH